MKKSLNSRIHNAFSWIMSAPRCPSIRWDEVVRIEALGTDAIGAFAVSVTFIYSDGSQATVYPEDRGYYDIIESLKERYPSISPTWYKEMSKQPWHVEAVLYTKPSEEASK